MGMTTETGLSTNGEAKPGLATNEMTPELAKAPAEPIMRFFEYAHLPADLQAVSSVFQTLADFIVKNIPRSAERTVALRKLLESKDAAVRASLP